MTFTPPPCPRCSGTSFQVLPDLLCDISRAVGSQDRAFATAKPIGRLAMTVVVCEQCGHTDLFTHNAATIAQELPGAYRARSDPPR